MILFSMYCYFLSEKTKALNRKIPLKEIALATDTGSSLGLPTPKMQLVWTKMTCIGACLCNIDTNVTMHQLKWHYPTISMQRLPVVDRHV